MDEGQLDDLAGLLPIEVVQLGQLLVDVAVEDDVEIQREEDEGLVLDVLFGVIVLDGEHV